MRQRVVRNPHWRRGMDEPDADRALERSYVERLGFTFVRPKGLTDCVMSIEVAPR